MKKTTLLLAAVFVAGTVFAQTAKKSVLFEHFTNVCCGPCADQNPYFQDNILANNWGKIHHISYHPSWPCSSDPMYQENTSDVDTRVQYYGVQGVPDMEHGNEFTGGPTSVTQSVIDKISKKGSYISMIVSEVDSGTTYRNVTIKITTEDASIPSGDLRLRVAVVEKEITYSSAPGNNAETFFPNVFRKMLPSIDGEAYTPAAQGSSVEFKYTYELGSGWDADSIYVIAFVQNDDNKYVLNSGSSMDLTAIITSSSSPVKNSYSGHFRKFKGTFTSTNTGTGDEQYNVSLTHNAPDDWTATLTIDGISYTDDATITLSNASSVDYSINVTPGNTAALSTYTITMESIDIPENFPKSESITVISGITDLVVNLDPNLDESGTNDISGEFKAGFTAAGNSSHAFTNTSVMIDAIENDELFMVSNIYYNAGWSSTSMTDDIADVLTKHLDNGGRLFLTGQDIGWEVWDLLGGADTLRVKGQAFYTNYLQATYLADKVANATYIGANSSDAVFGSLTKSDIDETYGSNYYFPDEIVATGNGQNVLYYNDDADDVAAVRNISWGTSSNYKTFYLGIGIEMVQNDLVKEEIVQTVHDWFSNITSTEEFDKQMKNLTILGQNYPNPSNGQTSITLNNLETNGYIEILDVTGRVVLKEKVVKGQDQITLNTKDLDAGSYMYRLIDEQGSVLGVHDMTVVK
ncbi:MAG: Omp28-related outer membrane protein [Bacteroidia bacterium]|nr:Omp28-related outer membrane protein [Bacteroidia bacterium]